jgi:hypothetical protein
MWYEIMYVAPGTILLFDYVTGNSIFSGKSELIRLALD